MKPRSLPSLLRIALLSLCLLLISPTTPILAACLADAFDKVFSTLLLQDLSLMLKDKLEQNLTRWASIPANKRKSQAIIGIEKSLCAAQDQAKNLGKNVGEFTAESQAKVLTGGGVLASERTSLENAGKGVGVIAARADVSDLTGKQTLEGIEKAITTGNSTTVQTFRDANYTVAESLDDLRTVFDSNPNLPAGKLFKDGQNPGKLGANDPGAVAEVGFAARKVRQGKTPIDLGADEGTGIFAGKAVDQHWNDNIYQVGLTSNTIEDKLKTPDSLAQVIKEAVEVLRVEKTAGRMPQTARFKFGYTVQKDWVPNPTPGGRIDELNRALRDAYHPLTPPNEAIFTVSDFELLPLSQ